MLNVSELLEKVIALDKKFIVVTGGVCSSLGKGVLISSLGVLLKGAGHTVSVVKWDPYLNVDPGTMSPLEHGEVFVTSDGAETDLDLGHYERMLGINLTQKSSVSSGQIFEEILKKERQGVFLGRCIQQVPHVVDAIKRRLFEFALDQDVDVVLIEIGGTIGDLEGTVFYEAIRQLRLDLGLERMMLSHLSYVPFLSWTGEVKTKPTQHSVIQLKRYGMRPNALFLRADKRLSEKSIKKLSVMCGVPEKMIFQVLTHDPIYNLFIDLDDQNVGTRVQEYFKFKEVRPSDLSSWKSLVEVIGKAQGVVKIGLIAKYMGSNDPYISVVEAIKAAAYHKGCEAKITVIEAEQLEGHEFGSDGGAWKLLKQMDGVVVPGGFDKRGVEGKVMAARWAREQNVPYLGLCLGLHIMLIEVARSGAGLESASSTEFEKNTPHPVISLLDEQQGVTEKGASMRLGNYTCKLIPNTKAHAAYASGSTVERHRHRYEFNNKYQEKLEQAGVVFSGVYEEKNLVEIAELKDHRFMLGTQAHPEFTSSPIRVNPLFKAFIDAVVKK